MRIASLIIGGGVASGAAAAPAHAAMTDAWDDTFVGVRHLERTGVDDAGVTQRYHVAIVDLDAAGVSVRAAQNHDAWRAAKEPTSAMAARHGAAVAVNGDYWSLGANDPTQGTLVVDGVCHRAHPERSAIAFGDGDGPAQIGRFGTWPIPDGAPDDCPAWIAQAIGAGPQFIFDGAPMWNATANANDPGVPDINGDTFFGGEAWGWGDGRQPNTAVGLSADGRLLVLVTCDGRGAGGAGGCRMGSDVVAIMQELGVDDALKLDSGGSTTFYYDGAVRNVPSDGNERPVVDALLVMAARRGEVVCAATLDGDAVVVVDDDDPCFTRSGASWWTALGGERRFAWWTYAWDQPADSAGTWRATVAGAGDYAVAVHVPAMVGALTARATYRLEDAAGLALDITVDQQANQGAWVTLGTFALAPGEVRLRLTDATGEPFAEGRRVVFDAVRFTPPGAAGPDAGPGASEDDEVAGGCGCRAAGQEAPRAPTGLIVALIGLWSVVRYLRRRED